MNNRIKLLIGLGIGLIILIGAGLAIQLKYAPGAKTPTVSEKYDPITGQTLVDIPGKSPEKASQPAGSVILGSDNIMPLFGNDEVFYSLRNNVFMPLYPQAKLIKISKDNVSKNVSTTNGITIIQVNFYVYIDTDLNKKDRFQVEYNQENGDIKTVVNGDYTGNRTFTTSIYGTD